MNRLSFCFLFVLFVAVGLPVFSGTQTVLHNPIVIHELKHDISPPLRDIPPSPESAGVKRISVSEYCTRCDNDRLFSHRAGDAGRQVGVVAARM